MTDMAKRSENNPLISPSDLSPSQEDLKIECVFNPGAFIYQHKIWLLLRVAERPIQEDDTIRLPILDNGQIKILELFTVRLALLHPGHHPGLFPQRQRPLFHGERLERR